MNKKQIITAILASASVFGYAQDNNVAATAANQKVQVAELQAEGTVRAEVELGEAPAATDLIWSERESLFVEPFVVENLSETGFAPSLVWTSEAWDNVSGGDRTADTSVLDSLVTLGIDQDLEVLTGVKNAGTFGMTAFWYTSNGAIESATSGASNIFSGDMTRVFEVYYANEVEVAEGTVSLRIGQLAADEDFMGVDYAGLFLNSSFGAMPGVAGIGNDDGEGFSQYALATLGFTVAYESESGVRAIFGLYNGNVGSDESANHGFDYELQDIAIWYEIGYSYELFGNASYAMFGGNYHSGTFANAAGDEKDGFYSFYFGLQQDLIVTPDGDPVFGAFFRLGYAPQDISEVDVYLDFGFNWFAPLAGRDDDVLGLGFSYASINSDFVDDYGIESDFMMELTYRCQLTPAIAIQPTAQIYFDTLNENGTKETSYVIGARLEIVF